MAGDWIKWEHGLIDKPEVLRLSSLLGVSREVAVCRLMRFWEWCDLNIPDEEIRETGSAYVVLSPRDGDNIAFIDSLVCTPNFADSLASVGWIRFRNGRIELPNFGRHNGQTAKTRARNYKNQNNKRKKRGGDNPADCHQDVTAERTQMSPRDGDKTVTREEKRREENTNTEIPPHPPSGETAKKTKQPEPFPEIPASLNTPAFVSAWDDWLAERRARGKKVTPRAAKLQLASLEPIGPAKAVECIRASIASGWSGLFPDRFRGTGQSNTNGQPYRPQGKGHVQADYWADQARKVFFHEQ